MRVFVKQTLPLSQTNLLWHNLQNAVGLLLLTIDFETHTVTDGPSLRGAHVPPAFGQEGIIYFVPPNIL